MIRNAALTRSRLTVRLKTAGRYPATVVCAPEGYGKTTAIRQFLEAHPAATLELGLLPEHGSLVSFARALAETLAPVAPGLRASFARAIEFALQSSSAEEELAIWILGHLDKSAERTVLLDDLHHCVRDDRIGNLIERLLIESPSGYRWLIASRVLPAAIERWKERRLCAPPLDEHELRFTETEMRGIAESMGLSPALAQSLYQMTRGWPLAFSLGSSLPQWIERLRVLRPGSTEGLYGFLAEQFFLQCDEPLQELLLNTCVFTTLDEALIDAGPWHGSWPHSSGSREQAGCFRCVTTARFNCAICSVSFWNTAWKRAEHRPYRRHRRSPRGCWRNAGARRMRCAYTRALTTI